MICKASSVLIVICITCFFIFAQLNIGNQNYYLLRIIYSNNDTIAPTSFIVDTKLSGEIDNNQNHSDSFSKPILKRLIISTKLKKIEGIKETSRQFIRMENNNGQIENNINIMSDASPEKKKIQEPSPTIEDDFSGQFNIKKLNDHLKMCIRRHDGQVDIDEYISIFQQLYKFFCMLGTLFGFIGSDVRSKIEILQGYRNGENRSHYETVEKMVAYEKSTDYIHTNKESSGSRTFLRLHRSLIFVSKFLDKMETLGDQDGISRVCKDAYVQTLAKFHPWLIQKGAGIAMLGLPSKKDLITKVCANGLVNNDEVIPIMKDVIKLTNDIYNQCENVYTEFDLHGLP